MPTIAEFFNHKDHKTKNVAARLCNVTQNLYYYEQVEKPGHIPPSVYVTNYFESTKRRQARGKIAVNYSVNSWINANTAQELHYTKKDIKALPKFKEACPVPKSLSLWEEFPIVPLGPAPSFQGLGAEDTNKAISRARRVYMLACFALLKKKGLIKKTRTHGHNIGSILCSDSGQVLSWGVNNGGYRHAEVNTIINYFRLNPTKSALPADAVLFSTLKPCRMCSTFIKSSYTGGKIRVWYGMMDEGGSGATPLLGKLSTPFKGEDFELNGMEWLFGDGSVDSSMLGTGTKPVRVTVKGGKVDLYATLNQSTGLNGKRGMSAADWVDKSPQVIELIEAAVVKLKGKMSKGRDDGPLQQAINHLKPFLQDV